MHRKIPERALGLVLDKALASPDEILFLRRNRDREIIFDAFQLDRKVWMVQESAGRFALKGIVLRRPGRQQGTGDPFRFALPGRITGHQMIAGVGQAEQGLFSEAQLPLRRRVRQVVRLLVAEEG